MRFRERPSRDPIDQVNRVWLDRNFLDVAELLANVQEPDDLGRIQFQCADQRRVAPVGRYSFSTGVRAMAIQQLPGQKPPPAQPPQPKPQEHGAEQPPESGALNFDTTLDAVSQAAPNLQKVVDRIRVLGHAICDPLS
jgi:hypothetical protein